MNAYTRSIYSATVVYFVLTAILMHGQNLITNGSFETYLKPPEQWTHGAAIGDHGIPVGDTNLEGWTVIQGNLDYVSGGWVASDGSRSLDLNGEPGSGGISQVIATQIGESYLLTFDLSGNPDHDFPVKTIRVRIADEGSDFSFDTLSSGATFGDMRWQRVALAFKADSIVTTIEFRSATPSSFNGPAIDNVQVRATSFEQAQTTIALYPGIQITGTVGARYRVEHTSDLGNPAWTSLGTLRLPSSPYLFFDTKETTTPRKRFYRVVLID